MKLLEIEVTSETEDTSSDEYFKCLLTWGSFTDDDEIP